MKKIFLIVSAVLLCTVLRAEVVTLEKAQQLAGPLLSDISGKKCTVKYVGSINLPSVRGAESPAFHIFNGNAGGFVILAGDDCVSPIIGYSDKGAFVTENMPENLSGWLEMWSGIINALRADGYVAGKDVKKQWEALQNGEFPTNDSPEKLLETAKWDQGKPYNLLCPNFLGSKESTRCVTGCTATALAIIMRYHNWPDCGVGKLDTYRYRDDSGTYREVEGFELGHKYDWANMPLKYTGHESDAQNEAVARLMYDVGVMLESEYNPASVGGTGSILELVAPGAIKHFKFDRSASMKYYDSYRGDWLQLIKDNIDNVGPVDYAAQDAGGAGGHSFVIDGYRGDQVHINWGWSGSDDGYFTIPNFDPAGYRFTSTHRAVFGLMKDQSNTPYSIEYATETKALTISARGGVEVEVKDSKGVEVKDAVTAGNNAVTVATDKLKLDSYSVSIKTASETVTITIKMGF